MAGTSVLPKAAASAVAEPVIPANIIEAAMLVWAMSPRSQPTSAEARRTRPAVIPEASAVAAPQPFAGKELAEHTGVSGATVSRLFRRLGYVSYEEARREARTLRDAGSPLHLLDSCGAARPSLIAQHIAEEARLVEVTLSMLSPLVLRGVAGALAEARHVWFTGFRNSRFLADYARALFTSLRSESYALVPSGQTSAEGVAGVGRGDIVMAFGMRRRLTSFVPLLEALSGQEADVLLVTDRSMKAPVPGVRWTLRCAVETARPIDSYAGWR
jgi:DNA-binding MurR/RpiR family transcriptional regulator